MRTRKIKGEREREREDGGQKRGRRTSQVAGEWRVRALRDGEDKSSRAEAKKAKRRRTTGILNWRRARADRA